MYRSPPTNSIHILAASINKTIAIIRNEPEPIPSRSLSSSFQPPGKLRFPGTPESSRRFVAKRVTRECIYDHFIYISFFEKQTLIQHMTVFYGLYSDREALSPQTSLYSYIKRLQEHTKYNKKLHAPLRCTSSRCRRRVGHH